MGKYNLNYTLEKYIIASNRSQSYTLKKLEYLIQDNGGLFKDDPFYQEFRKLYLQYRITLLLHWGRYAEALAWICLETELNPANVDAVAMKEQLKKQLHFTKEENHVSVNNASQKPLFDWGNVAGMRRVKAIIERDVLLPLKEREIYQNFNVSIPKGLLRVYDKSHVCKNLSNTCISQLKGLNAKAN
ncbi:MAG: hypothetical protein K0B37_16230 [Bacteroidales bacterium]|nr:hypothetical protein [Bacteroidales bacterium]